MVGRRFPRDGLNAKLCAKVADPSSNRALNPPTTVSATPLPVHKITAAPARRRMAAAARLLALLGLLATGPLRAAAEAPAGSYEGIIRLAVEEFDRGHWQEAIVLFKKAHALKPSARTHRGLGLAYFEARRYVQAVRHLGAALQDTRKPLTEGQTAHARQALARAQDQVGELLLVLTPAEATVAIDGVNRDVRAGAVVLSAGPHHLRVHAPGFRSLERDVEVQGKQRQRLELRLETLAQVGPGSGPRADSRPPDAVLGPGAAPKDVASDESGPWPWVVMAGGAVVAAAGGALLWSAMQDIDAVEQAEPGTRWSELEGPYERAPLLSGVGIGLISAGGVGLVAGLVWGAVSGEEEPTLSAGPQGLGLRHRF